MPDQLTIAVGYLIAFVCPGLVVLVGIAQLSPTVRSWFGIAASADVTVGGFLFVGLTALALGVTVSAVRVVLIDRRGWFTRLDPTALARMRSTTEGQHAYADLREQYFRYYQANLNTLIAAGLAVAIWLFASSVSWSLALLAIAGVLVMSLVLWRAAEENITLLVERVAQYPAPPTPLVGFRI